MSDEVKAVEDEEVIEEELEEEGSKKKKKKSKKEKKDKKEINFDFNKLFGDIFGSIDEVFTKSASMGFLYLQIVIGVLLATTFIGGFFGKLLALIVAFVGILGARALQVELMSSDEDEDNDEDSEDESEEE